MKPIKYTFTMEFEVVPDSDAHKRALELKNEVNSGRFSREMMEDSVEGYKSLRTTINEVNE